MRNIGKWQGQDVEIVRAARKGDAGFDPSQAIGEQVLVKLVDGSEKIVTRRDVVTRPEGIE